jgi:hypothetical protein
MIHAIALARKCLAVMDFVTVDLWPKPHLHPPKPPSILKHLPPMSSRKL